MAVLSFTTTFNLTGTPAFNFTDTSNYAGQGIQLADVVGDFTIVSPSGNTIYNNTAIGAGTCDINIVASLNSQLTILLPLYLGTQNPEQGVYTIIYSVWNSNLNTWSTQTNSYTYTFVTPTVTITQTVDCLSPLFTSNDTTVYTVDGVVPSKTEVHTINYPYGSAGEATPATGVGIQLTTTTFYQGTQTTEISSVLVYTYPDGHIVNVTITGSLEVQVDCKDVCGIYCCIRSIEQQKYDAMTVNKVEYARLTTLFDDIMSYVGFALLAIRCGKSTDVSGLLEKIRLLAHCESDCGCTGTTPAQVTGLGGLVNSAVVNSGGSPITVTPVTVGNTTTYTVSLSSTFVNLVNSFYLTVVAAGDNITVSDSGVIAGVRTFTVNGLKTVITSTGGTVTVTPAGPVAGVTTYNLEAPSGDKVLYYTVTPVSNSTGAPVSLQSYLIAANQLATNGDSLEIIGLFTTVQSIIVFPTYSIVTLYIGGVITHIKVSAFDIPRGAKYLKIKAVATRKSATELFMEFETVLSDPNYNVLGTGNAFFELTITPGNNFAGTNLIDFIGTDGTADVLTCEHMKVTYFKK